MEFKIVPRINFLVWVLCYLCDFYAPQIQVNHASSKPTNSGNCFAVITSFTPYYLTVLENIRKTLQLLGVSGEALAVPSRTPLPQSSALELLLDILKRYLHIQVLGIFVRWSLSNLINTLHKSTTRSPRKELHLLLLISCWDIVSSRIFVLIGQQWYVGEICSRSLPSQLILQRSVSECWAVSPCLNV